MSFLKCVEPAYNSKINTLKSKYSIQTPTNNHSAYITKLVENNTKIS